MRRDAGFTLIEVLAALLVFSIAIIGLTRAGAESARAVSAVDEKMLAGIVADNQLVMARMRPVQTGTQRGEETVMSRLFTYELITAKTDTAGFYKIDVKVRADGRDYVVVSRTAFRRGPR